MMADKLSLWMRFGQPLEPVLDNPEVILDAWQAGGVRAIVFGRLMFTGSDATPMSVPTFDPNPAVYQDLDVEPPAGPTESLPEKRQQLEKTLTLAKERGFRIFVFCPDAGQGKGGDGHPLEDERSLRARVARIRDVMEAYPMVDGGVVDGPELGYEIDPDHRSYLFDDLPETLRPAADRLGFDYDAMIAARDRWFDHLHHLRPADIDLRADGGCLGMLELFGGDPDLAAFFAFRRALLMDYYSRQSAMLGQMPRKVTVCAGSRLPCFNTLTGSDLQTMAGLYDVLLPKLYFYHRGFDGFYGTIGRYVKILTKWSPDLTDAHAMKVVEGLLGIRLPWVRSRLDLDLGFPQPGFDEFVGCETRRMLAAAPPERVVPWLEAGREPHHGDPISSGDLHRIVKAARDVGLRQCLYHSHTHLTAAEWAVLSDLCGQGWHDGLPGYQPPDDLAWESRAKRG